MMQRCFICLLLLLTISGCAHRGSFTPPPDLVAHQQQLQRITHWELNGKLGIRTPDESGSASLKWAQQLADYQINLSGPLGQKRMIITGTPGKVRLEQTGSDALEARSAEALIKKAAGWTLPVEQLTYWVRGVPAPKQRITHLQQNESGLIAQLQQGGWSIAYSNYKNYTFRAHGGGTAPANQTFTLPGKITAEHDDVRLILVIRDWQLGNQAPH
ncbi:outer membrane lipoprotein LolB [Cellvibrio mixtus]|uniref:Outer-membrane lipoprotein LolB n=1 Tax=Cellvibrio mixtus TaxID=39650 RepID=A0A266QA34_9GAMM|nr:lipoprotein insertase outer membrane protein LolB [Cellvibrio mixtus]OZY86712.1 outer membrane lipoprotein LolB [Cellvibrio mixtus]